MKRFLVISLVIFLSSCSAEWHLQQAIKKGIELSKDTLSLVDTIITKEVFHDTTVITKPNDTVVLYKDQWHVKIVRVNDTLAIEGGCTQDTLIIERIVPYERVVNKVDYWSGIKPLLRLLAIILALLIAGWVVFKKI